MLPHRLARRTLLALASGVALSAAGLGAEFRYDRARIAGPTPWNSDRFNAPQGGFRFAVIGDRTGGADVRGVFPRAIDQLNLLQPEFVINVGDLIEGYSRDSAKLAAEWDEVDAMLGRLSMPFFRTVGNHDVASDVAAEVWGRRYGPQYYHFVYGDVLFLVLNTEDPPRPGPPDMEERIEAYNRMQREDPARAREMVAEFMALVASEYGKPANFSDAQVAYAEQALAQNPGVRWTFVLMHEPAWKNPTENFLRIERALQGRPYTVLAGHLHYYEREERHGRDYITMGPAGASFHQDGPGNVDHVLWVTMHGDRPEIAKITLEGIFDRNGRDPEMQGMYQRQRQAR